MCIPAAIAIPVALAAAGTAVSVIGQISAANATNAAIKAQEKTQEHQIDEQTGQEITDRLRQARRDMGRIMVAAGESGLSLDSGAVKALENDAAMQASLSNETSLANRESRKEAARDQANAEMVSKPTLLGAGIQIALAGGSAAIKAGALKPGGVH